MQSNPHFAFWGTPDLARNLLDVLDAHGFRPALAITGPDQRVGRGMKLTPPPVKQWALERSIPIYQPEKIDETCREKLAKTKWDFFLVFAYGMILPENIISLPGRGSLNVHPSLLPKYRGPSPIQSVILADDQNVGTTIIQMDTKMDHGAIIAQTEVDLESWPIAAPELADKLIRASGELLAETIPLSMSGLITPRTQNHSEATYTRKIEKDDGKIDLEGNPYQNYLKYCAYTPWPGVFFIHEKGGKKLRIKIAEAAFEDDSFIPLVVTPPNSPKMSYDDFLRK